MASKITKWLIDWKTGVMSCTIDAINKTAEYDVKVIFPEWDEMTDIQKHCVYTGLKPKLEDTTAESKDMKQTPAERYAKISNMWNRLTVDEVWSLKSGERDTPQKRLAGMKIISASMAKAAILLGMKVGADTTVVSDAEYDILMNTNEDE
jgi:hypothetical protein